MTNQRLTKCHIDCEWAVMDWPRCVKPPASAWVSVYYGDQCLIFVLTMIDLQIACSAQASRSLSGVSWSDE